MLVEFFRVKRKVILEAKSISKNKLSLGTETAVQKSSIILEYYKRTMQF